MKKLFILAIFILSMAEINIAQTKDEQAVAAAVETLRKAMVEGDSAALTNIAAPQLTYGHSSGLLEDRPTYVHNIASRKSNFVKIDLTAQTITIVDKTAIVRHHLDAETNDMGKGPGSVKLSVLLVWHKKAGVWKLLARQAVKR